MALAVTRSMLIVSASVHLHVLTSSAGDVELPSSAEARGARGRAEETGQLQLRATRDASL